jgi:hypothetical protein
MENFTHVNSISPAADGRWGQLSTSVQQWAVIFSSGQNGRKLTYNQGDWQALFLTTDGYLNSELAPFQFGEEVGNAS